jgi:2-polyprenyl-3-methyl-5-hydroxy-6-metoxy-1,4-benzoquinol methylase
MKKPSVEQYFNMHVHEPSYQLHPQFYKATIEFIHDHQQKAARPITILDVGCGNGAFIEAVLESGISIASIVGVDVSQSMIDVAKERLAKFQNVRLEVADGFELSKALNAKFDIIHIAWVLHHLVARTQGSSKKLAIRMIKELLKLSSIGGIIIIEELHYKSSVSPKITSKIIFYGLKLLNALHIDGHRFMPDLHPGLEVNFFYQKELAKLLSAFGQVTIVYSEKSEIGKIMRYFLLNEFGRVTFSLAPNKTA